jgi:hypothetical protein
MLPTLPLLFGFAFGHAAGDVVAGELVASHAYDEDDTQSPVGVAVAAAVESVPNGFTAGGL